MKCVPKTGILIFFATPVTSPLWLKNARNNSTCHPRFRPRFPPNHPNLSALFLIPWEWSGLQPGEACSSRLSFIPGSVLGFGVGLLKPENWWVSILGSVLGFSLIILKSKPLFWGMFWRMRKKTVEGEEASISAVLHPRFRPRFQPNHPKRPSAQVSFLMIRNSQKNGVKQKLKSSLVSSWG